MMLDDYIKGSRTGREAHGTELDAMLDPLLGDALDGFDAVSGDHPAAMDRLSERIEQSASAGRAAALSRAQHLRERRVRSWSIAAAALFLGGVIGGGVLLFGGEVPADDTHATTTRKTMGEQANEVMDEVLPPITVIPNEPAAEATDISGLEFDELEIHDTDAGIADTTVTIAFKRYVAEWKASRTAAITEISSTSGLQGVWARASFDVSADGRPESIEIIEASSPEAARAAFLLISNGPNWDGPAKKLITVNL